MTNGTDSVDDTLDKLSFFLDSSNGEVNDTWILLLHDTALER